MKEETSDALDLLTAARRMDGIGRVPNFHGAAKVPQAKPAPAPVNFSSLLGHRFHPFYDRNTGYAFGHTRATPDRNIDPLQYTEEEADQAVNRGEISLADAMRYFPQLAANALVHQQRREAKQRAESQQETPARRRRSERTKAHEDLSTMFTADDIDFGLMIGDVLETVNAQ